jgi:uncharacterized repeat protein (TIGR01451 family)
VVGVSITPTPTATLTSNQQIVQVIAVDRLEQLAQPTSEVPMPPVQLPVSDDDANEHSISTPPWEAALNFVHSLLAGFSAPQHEAQVADPCGAAPAIEVTSAVDKSSAAVGDDGTYTLTVSNPGTTDLSAFTLQVALPTNGLELHTATAGTIDPLTDGLPSVVLHRGTGCWNKPHV